MTSHTKLAVVLAVLTLIVVACGATPTATPTTAPRALPTATPAVLSQSTAAPTVAAMTAATATKAPASAPTSPLAPVATRPPAATATQATEQAPAGNTPDVIANAQLAVLKQKAFRVRIKITGETGTVTDMITEYVLPDRVHMIISDSETIVIKNVGFWRKAAGGQWQSLPAAMSANDAIFAALDPKQIDTLVQGITVNSFKSLGVELLDGKPMRTYQYATNYTNSGMTIDATSKIWIGVADGLPYKIEGSSTNSATPGGKSLTTNLYEYDNNIKIEAPM